MPAHGRSADAGERRPRPRRRGPDAPQLAVAARQSQVNMHRLIGMSEGNGLRDGHDGAVGADVCDGGVRAEVEQPEAVLPRAAASGQLRGPRSRQRRATAGPLRLRAAPRPPCRPCTGPGPAAGRCGWPARTRRRGRRRAQRARRTSGRRRARRCGRAASARRPATLVLLPWRAPRGPPRGPSRGRRARRAA